MTYYLGVDLGTTYTAAAMVREGRAEPVTLGSSSVAIPSAVYLDGDHLVVGQPALRRAATEPARVASEFKRRMGDPVPLVVDHQPVAADRLMALLLDWVVARIGATEGTAPESLAVTHPANWGEYKLDLFRRAIGAVGLVVDHLVPEPVAAASFYASHRSLLPGTVVAVYDLGGGTFDAALVQSERDGFRIIGDPVGIERLGGVDFDRAVLHHVAETAGLDLSALDTGDQAVTAGLAQLRSNCVEAKESLSAETDVTIPVMLPGLHTSVRLTRPELETMIEPALQRTLGALRDAMTSAGVDPDGVDTVLLVGGSSRIPRVAEAILAAWGRPVAVDARPKDAISMGAALDAWRSASSQQGPTAVRGPAAPGTGHQQMVPQMPGSEVSGGGPSVPGPLAGGERGGSRKRRAAGLLLLAGLALLAIVLGFTYLAGGDGSVPQSAVDRFDAACRASEVNDELCACAVAEAQAQLTTEQFMANDRLLQETGHAITEDAERIMVECQERTGQ